MNENKTKQNSEGDIVQQTITGGTIGSVFGMVKDSTFVIGGMPEGNKKELLKQIQADAEKIIAAAPEAVKEETKQNLNLLSTVATDSKPNRKWYSISAEGLVEASKFVKDFSGNIAGTIGQLGKMIWPDFTLPGVKESSGK